MEHLDRISSGQAFPGLAPPDTPPPPCQTQLEPNFSVTLSNTELQP